MKHKAAFLLPVLLLAACASQPDLESPVRVDAPVTGGIRELAEVDCRPVMVSSRPPRYPTALRRHGIVGEALIEFVVSADGSVRNARVVRATHEEFGDAAVECVHDWRFKPGAIAGNPVNTLMQVPIVFSLNVR